MRRPCNRAQFSNILGISIDLILGTAGHIDHGKTALVKALTGVDTDRLPEEKRRGITIELGFAELPLGEYRLGVVDVPGHERFVRNMLAGATGIDLALLVVAADESVKPQTREHLDILQLLGVAAGVIAVTKCDAADPDWIDLVEQEIRELVQDTFLAEAPIVRTSARRGTGLDDLRQALTHAAAVAVDRPGRSTAGPFRLPIDRVFTVPGHGAVVTGSVVGGVAHIGDELVVQPGEIRVRIRGLHHHDREAAAVGRGQRAAVNLAGVRHEDLERGQELCSPGFLQASKTLTVRLQLLPSAARPLVDRARLHVHLGATEFMATVRLLDADDVRLIPGGAAVAQLFCNRPVATAWGQPFIIRSESPVRTIGGGQVLQCDAQRIRRQERWRIDAVRRLADADRVVVAAAALELWGLRAWQPLDLARWCGAENPADTIRALDERRLLTELSLPPTRKQKVATAALQHFFAQATEALAKLHAREPLAAEIELAKLQSRMAHTGDADLIEASLHEMARRGQLALSARGVALPGRGPKLSAGEQMALDELVAKYLAAGLNVPSVDELRQAMPKHQAAAAKLLNLAASQGRLVAISPEMYLHADVLADVRETLTAALSGGGLTLSQIRERLGTTRKYAVPLCEYLDRCGFTQRNGDLRVLEKSEVR